MRSAQLALAVALVTLVPGSPCLDQLQASRDLLEGHGGVWHWFRDRFVPDVIIPAIER